MNNTKSGFLALYLFTIACYGAAITYKLFDGEKILQNEFFDRKSVKNYPCEHPFITRIKRDSEQKSGEKSEEKMTEIEHHLTKIENPGTVLTPKDNKLIRKALKFVTLKLTSEKGDADAQVCSRFLEWQQKQVREFNKLSKKWNQKKLKKLYDPDFSVKLGKSITKSTTTCGSEKPKLCRFYQEFMDKKWAKFTRNKALTKILNKCEKISEDEVPSKKYSDKPTKLFGMTISTIVATIVLLLGIILLFGLSKYCNEKKEKRFQQRMSQKDRLTDTNSQNFTSSQTQNAAFHDSGNVYAIPIGRKDSNRSEDSAYDRAKARIPLQLDEEDEDWR